MSGNAPKRLLVLTSATGAGHDTHARATAAWCARLFGDGVEVTLAHALEDSHPIYRAGVDFYNFIQRRCPGFHHVYYNVIELLDLLNPGTVGLGRAYFVRLLETTRPDAILSVMDCLNRGYFELARAVLGPSLRCATYCTEFEGGYGFSRNWVNPRADFFFARTAEAAVEAVRRGVPRDRAVVAGHWAPPAFYLHPMGADAAQIFLRDQLQLDPARFTLLLSTGGAGAQNHVSFLRALAPLGDRLQVIALCGHDTKARARVEAVAREEIPFTVRALGQVDNMAELLQVSSAVVARGGATTAGESLLCRCPAIFNAIGGTMPQELPTLRWFQRRKMGPVIHQPATLLQIISRWLDRPETPRRLTFTIPLGPTQTPEVALRLLLGL
jgi:processive 1,2-diacylglycerol beta-glucosyltransferase